MRIALALALALGLAALSPVAELLVQALPYLGMIGALLAGSAFFSGSESALFSLDRVTLDGLAAETDRTARAIPALRRDPQRLLATLLLGNEIINVTISVVGAQLVFLLAGGAEASAWWLNIVFVTPLLLLFGEIGPKAVAVRNPMAWSRLVALPLTVFMGLVAPLRVVLDFAARLVLRPLGAEDDPLPETLAEAQFKALVELGQAQGTLPSDEAELIHRVFELSDTPVSKIMTPRTDLVTAPITASLPDLLELGRSSGFSRVPVYSGEPDAVRGVLVVKDLLEFRWGGRDLTPRVLESTLNPAYFVPPTKKAGELMREFQASRLHMAVVIDEYGATLGIVTMTDVLEELLGTLGEDEAGPTAGPGLERIGEGHYRVPARFEVAEWNRNMRPGLPVDPAWTTVAGYIFHLFGRLPAKGEEVRTPDWTFHVSGLEGTRITGITAKRRAALTTTRLPPVEEEPKP